MSKEYVAITIETSQVGGISNRLSMIQRLLSQLPEIGQIYAPASHPDAHMRVKKVSVFLHQAEDEEDTKPTGLISCCAPDDPNEEYPELLLDEWAEHRFAQVVE